MKHIEDQEVDSYTEEVKKYDQISRLDPWYTSLLLKVKRQRSPRTTCGRTENVPGKISGSTYSLYESVRFDFID